MTSAATKIREQFRSLTDEERLEVLMELWTAVTGPESVKLSDADREVLNERLAEHEANPDDTILAAEVFSRLRKRDRD